MQSHDTTKHTRCRHYLLLLVQGDNLHDDQDVDETAKQRRLKMIAAVQGDNWSEVISDQTTETLAATAAAAAAKGTQTDRLPAMAVAAAAAADGSDTRAAGGQMVSPFSKPTVHRQVGEAHKVGRADNL